MTVHTENNQVSQPRIHPTALVAAGAQLHSTVEIGAYTVVGQHVCIGANTTIASHCVIEGHTTIGENNRIFQFNSLGAIPQDKKYAGEPCQLHIGDRNLIREFCTFNIGSPDGGEITRLGSDNWVMAYVHLAHDCQVGSHTVLANNTTLGGHVTVGDWVTIGGLTGIHQFVCIGTHAMLGFASAVTQDVPPFMLADGNPLSVRGINTNGLRRRQFSEERIQTIKRMYKTLYRQGLSLQQVCAHLQSACAKAKAKAKAKADTSPERQDHDAEDAQLLLDFITQSQRGISR